MLVRPGGVSSRRSSGWEHYRDNSWLDFGQFDDEGNTKLEYTGVCSVTSHTGLQATLGPCRLDSCDHRHNAGVRERSNRGQSLDTV